MRKFRHPYSKAVYEEVGDGVVRVTHRERTGTFHADGRWIEGELTQADPHTLMWVGGPDLLPEASTALIGWRGRPLTRQMQAKEGDQ